MNIENAIEITEKIAHLTHDIKLYKLSREQEKLSHALDKLAGISDGLNACGYDYFEYPVIDTDFPEGPPDHGIVLTSPCGLNLRYNYNCDAVDLIMRDGNIPPFPDRRHGQKASDLLQKMNHD